VAFLLLLCFRLILIKTSLKILQAIFIGSVLINISGKVGGKKEAALLGGSLFNI
jgi:hypothetical protein